MDDAHLVNNCIDLLPTLCELAGVDPPEGLPGRSFKGLALGDEPRTWRDYVVSETVAGRMLRSARYKYCIYHHEKVSEEQLCDLQEDPLETENLVRSPAHQRVVREHRQLLAEWAQQAGDRKGTDYLSAI